jgi:phosphohistidine phosphatase
VDIYLLRHGDAVDRLTGGYARDEERPLTDAGRAEARAAVGALRALGETPDLILTSPLVRAEATARIAADLLRPARGLARCDALAPGGEPDAIVRAIVAEGLPTRTLLVGHMPDLGELAGWLVWGDPGAALALRTGGLCRITTPDHPVAGSGDLRWLLTPKLLRKLG